jgi:hypothetical protein
VINKGVPIAKQFSERKQGKKQKYLGFIAWSGKLKIQYVINKGALVAKW